MQLTIGIYRDMDEDKELQKDKEQMEDFKNICKHICTVEERLIILQENLEGNTLLSLKSVAEEIRAFIVDRLNEVRFLFKRTGYEYEHELRLVQCSHKPEIDNHSFAVPRLYIDMEKEIENLTVKLGSKLEDQQIKEIKPFRNLIIRRIKCQDKQKNNKRTRGERMI